MSASKLHQRELAAYLFKIGKNGVAPKSTVTRIAETMAFHREAFMRSCLSCKPILDEAIALLRQTKDREVRFDYTFSLCNRMVAKAKSAGEKIEQILAITDSKSKALSVRTEVADLVMECPVRLRHYQQWFKDTKTKSRLSKRDVAALEKADKHRVAYIRFKQELVRTSLQWVVKIAMPYRNRGLELADLIQEGNKGLLIAADGFDPRLGYAFSTYAKNWIQQKVVTAVTESTRVVKLPQKLIREYCQRKVEIDSKVQEKRGHLTTAERNAVLMKNPLVKAWFSNLEHGALSTDKTFEDGTRIEFDQVQSTVPESTMTKESERAELKYAMENLDSRSQTILRLRFGFEGQPHTLNQAGKAMGLSRERVRQLEVAALEQLKSILS